MSNNNFKELALDLKEKGYIRLSLPRFHDYNTLENFVGVCNEMGFDVDVQNIGLDNHQSNYYGIWKK